MMGQCTQRRFADGTKLEGVADTPESHAVIQGDINRLGTWANVNLMKFSKCKGQVLHWNNLKHQDSLVLISRKAAW